MIFGSTKTKLEYIIDNGFRRIDKAVNRVIDIHAYSIIVEDMYIVGHIGSFKVLDYVISQEEIREL